MTLKVKIAAGVVVTALGGIGTYTIIKHRTGSSLDKSVVNDVESEEEEDVSSENDEHIEKEEYVPKPVEERDARIQTDDPTEGPNSSTDKKEGEGKTKFQPMPYKEYLISQKITPIDENTDKEDIRNTILQRPFPHYMESVTLTENGVFPGSPNIKIEGKTRKINDKTMYIFNKNGDEDVEKLRQSCIKALSQIKTENEKRDSNFYKLKY